MTALLWCDKMHKNIGKKLLHLTIEFFLHGALDAQPFTTGGQGAIINPTDRSVGKEREHFHAEIQR